MAATITATGTWSTITGLSSGLSGQAGLPGLNRPIALGLNFESLKTQDGVILPELRQFIAAMAAGYGISHWTAADLCELLLRAYRQSATPLQHGDDTGSRLYTP